LAFVSSLGIIYPITCSLTAKLSDVCDSCH